MATVTGLRKDKSVSQKIIPQNPAAGLETTKSESQDARSKLLWKLLEILHTLPGIGNAFYCRRKLQYKKTEVEVKQQTDTSGRKKTFFGNLYRCCHDWTCPFCARESAMKREKEVGAIIEAVTAFGWSVSHVTLTIYHDKGSKLSDMFLQYEKAVRAWKNRKAWKSWKKQHGYEGDIKALEVNLGEGGWHLHAHYCIITRREVSEDELHEIFTMWKDACVGVTARPPSEKAFFARTLFADEAAGYLCKWGLTQEIARSDEKISSEGSTWWQILYRAGQGQRYYETKALEYIQATRRQRRMVFSNNLRKLLECLPKVADESDEDQATATTIRTLSPREWVAILRTRSRGALLHICENYSAEIVDQYIRSQVEIAYAGRDAP